MHFFNERTEQFRVVPVAGSELSLFASGLLIPSGAQLDIGKLSPHLLRDVAGPDSGPGHGYRDIGHQRIRVREFCVQFIQLVDKAACRKGLCHPPAVRLFESLSTHITCTRR